MKLKPRFQQIYSFIILITGLMWLYSCGVSESRAAGPIVQFSEVIKNFGTVMAGDMVLQDFAFTNIGDAKLILSGVYPTCNCTTVNDWTREAAPGQKGNVSLQLDSTHLSGSITKTIIVMSNDQGHHNLMLSLQGVVKKPLDMTPPMAILKPAIDGDMGVASVVHIKNNLAERMTLGNPVCDNPAFAAELKTIVPEREFQLTVRIVKPVHGTMFQGSVTIRTSSTRIPSIVVPVLIIPQSQLVLTPPVITFPHDPLGAATNLTVTLSNPGKNLLVIADAKMDVPDAVVQMKETQPGREFIFTLSFPAGFRLPRDRESALIINVSNSGIPTITVPLRPSGQTIHGSGMVMPQSAPFVDLPQAAKP